MPKVCTLLAVLLWLTLSSAAQSSLLPDRVGLRYSEQVSNSPVGSSDYFAMQGAAADAFWKIVPLSSATNLGLAIDVAAENTHNINHAGYGLDLFSFTAGPRLKYSTHRVQPFAQALFGLAHGWGSEFPSGGNTLASSANAFAFDLGAGADYPLNKQLSLRVLQLDYLRTSLPNNANDRQNNLRIGAGLTLRLSR
jgi:peptidoglycan-associated lipoprotein